MHHLTFLQDLALVMCVAGVTTIFFRAINQPIVLGYIIAGVIIGPHTPPVTLIGDEETIKTLAELGIIFLMFSLGLEFSLRKLQKVGSTAFIGAFLEIALMILAGYELGQFFGWGQMDSIFLGAILSISSTTIIIKALEGLGKTKEHFARLVFGILIIEDILAIVMIALLTGFATTGAFDVAKVGMTVLSLGSFLGTLLVVGLIIVPRLLNYVAKFQSDEVLLVTVIGLCFGVSLITVKLGYSVALGAFLIGAIIAEARSIAKIETLMHPIRDMFSAVFFVSIGLLIDPALLLKYAGPILIITAVVVFGKVLACSLGTFLAGNDTKTSLRVGMGLAQIGEFSFIIASLGLTHKATSDFLYPIAVAVSALTTLFTPYLIKSSDSVVGWFDRLAPRAVIRGLDGYTEWIRGLAAEGEGNFERKILGKLALQLTLNFLLLTGIFLTAVYLLHKFEDDVPGFPGGDDGFKAAIWLAAMIASFPLMIAIWRKMEVCAMVISEMGEFEGAPEAHVAKLRVTAYYTCTVVGTGLIVLIVFLLSSALLPSWNMLLLASLVVAVAGMLLYRIFVKVYARVQYALRKTFEEPADPPASGHGHGHGHGSQAAVSPILKEARLETMIVAEKVEGKKLVELQLRTETGATLVGIERGGKSIVNPGPQEVLKQGDQILVLGNAEQLEKAKRLLSAMDG